MSNVQVPTFTTTEFTVTASGALLTMRTAPASKVQFGVQPLKTTDGEPSHGVGKLAGFARRYAAYPTKTCTLAAAKAGAAGSATTPISASAAASNAASR